MKDLIDFVKDIRADFDKVSKNMDSMEKGLQFVEYILRTRIFLDGSGVFIPEELFKINLILKLKEILTCQV